MAEDSLTEFVIVLVVGAAASLLAIMLPLWLARRCGRGVGLTHLGSRALSAAPRLQRLVIDADRTVTTGNLVVTEVKPLDPRDDRTLRWFAGALAHRASDPVNRAISKLAGAGRTTEVTEDPEFGIRGSVDRHPVRIGTADWLEPQTISPLGSTVAVELDHRPLGRISVADEVRTDASRHLESLRRHGVEPLIVSSAAMPAVARIAELAGVEEWRADSDAPTVTQQLGGASAGVGWAAVRHSSTAGIDGSQTPGPVNSHCTGSELGRWEVELVLPVVTGQYTTVRFQKHAVGSIVTTIVLLRRANSARRLGFRIALGCLVVLIGLATAGLLNPALALVCGTGAMALVAAVTLARTVARPL